MFGPLKLMFGPLKLMLMVPNGVVVFWALRPGVHLGVVWLQIWVVSGLVEWGSPWVSMCGGHTGLGGIGRLIGAGHGSSLLVTGWYWYRVVLVPRWCWYRVVLVPGGTGTGVMLVPPRLVSEI